MNFKHNMGILENQSCKVKKMYDDLAHGSMQTTLKGLDGVLSRIEEDTT